jgi:hypothetical protein
MALVHSRVRRVVYGAADSQRGALGSCLSLHEIASLNHHYEVNPVWWLFMWWLCGGCGGGYGAWSLMR